MDLKGHGQGRKLVILTVSFALALWTVIFIRNFATNNSTKHINNGIEFIRLGQPIRAEHEWLEASKTDANNAVIWELLSELYINTEQWTRGLTALDHLHKIDPNHKLVYSRMAACALRSGNELEAQRFANQELKVNPRDEASLTILAFLASMQENLEQQIGYLQQIRSISPNSIEPLHDLAQAYSESGKNAEALKCADDLLKLKPGDGFALALRAASRYEVDGSPNAAQLCENDLISALKLNPLSGFARYTLGKVYMRAAKYDMAITQLELAANLFPRKLDVPFELATCYSRTNQPEKATKARTRFELLRKEATEVSVLQKRCSLQKNDFDAHLKLGNLMLQNGSNRQALYYLQRALILNPKSAEASSTFSKLSEQISTSTASTSSTR